MFGLSSPIIEILKKWLRPPVFEADDEKTLRASLLNAMLLTAIGVVLVVLPGTLIGGKTPALTQLIDFFFLGLCLALLWGLRRGHVHLTGQILVISGFVIITALVASLGTVRTPTTTAYVLVVIASSILFESKGLLSIMAAIGLALIGLVLAENAQLLPQPVYEVTLTQWVTFTALFGMSGLMVQLIHHYMQEGLEKSKRALIERQRAEDDSRKLLQAVNQSPSSIVITDLEGSIEYVNPRFTQVTGYTPEEAIGNNPRILKTEETPWNTHSELWKNLLEGKEWRGEFVNRKKDGTTYIEYAVIAPILDEHGKATNFVAVKEDVTERKRIEEALRSSEIRYRSLFDQVHDGVFILDLHGRHIIANQRAADMLGYTQDELIGLSVEDISAETEQTGKIREQMFAGEHIPLFERLFRRKDGEVFPVEVSVELVRDEEGNPRHIQSVVRDIQERKKAEEALRQANEQLRLRMTEVEELQAELREQALHDPLTGLYNRRYLNETLPREIIRMKREQTPLSVVMGDIDYFKMLNDTHGHLVGDQFLVEVSRLLKNHARGSDIICRYGGEEFLLAMPGVDPYLASQRAEEILQRCAEITIHHQGQVVRLSMSFGVAAYPIHGQEPEVVIRKADRALYQAKERGRNQVVIWTD